MPDTKPNKSSKKPMKSAAKKTAKKVTKKVTRKPRKVAPKKGTKKRVTAKTVCKQQKQNLRDILMQCQEVDTLKHAIDIMQEQLGSYILLGYSFDGTPITAVAATTPQQFDALQSRCVQFITQAHMGGPGNIPRPPIIPPIDDSEE